MKLYLLSTYQPDGPPPASIDLTRVTAGVSAFASELKEAGAWVFGSHLAFADDARVVLVRDSNSILTDGPYVEGREHIGGITIINCQDLDAALAWAGKLSAATALPIEVRPFMEMQSGLE